MNLGIQERPEISRRKVDLSSNDMAQAHGNFRLKNDLARVLCGRMECDTHAFDPKKTKG